MPGLNKQGPEGNGPMSGRQQGMCRRTDDLSLRGRRDSRGRGIGGRCRGAFPDISAGQAQKMGTSPSDELRAKTDELSILRSEYKKTQEMLASLMQKITALEGKSDKGDQS